LLLPYDKPLPALDALMKEPRLKKMDEVNDAIETFENDANLNANTGSVIDLMK